MSRVSCYFCNENNEHMLEEHHVVPRRFGGSDADENLVTVCASCHNGLESLYDSRFYDELDVEKRSLKQEGLKSFDEKHPFIWVVKSHCTKHADSSSLGPDRVSAPEKYSKKCSVRFFRNKFSDYVSDFSDKKIVRKLQSDDALHCGFSFRRLETESVESDDVVFRLFYSSGDDDFVDGSSPGKELKR